MKIRPVFHADGEADRQAGRRTDRYQEGNRRKRLMIMMMMMMIIIIIIIIIIIMILK